MAPARMIALLFFELFEQLHRANAPQRATFEKLFFYTNQIKLHLEKI